ncbi:hypothetical protein KAI46_06420 [bacterium]|nr:hypothetical protein [bacterium]
MKYLAYHNSDVYHFSKHGDGKTPTLCGFLLSSDYQGHHEKPSGRKSCKLCEKLAKKYRRNN